MKSYKGKSCIRFISVILSAVMLLTMIPAQVFAAGEKDSELDLAVISGISYVSAANRGGYNQAFLLDAAANGFQYEQLDSLLDSSLEAVKNRVENENLKYLLINGPLTYSGEYSNHVEIAAKLEAFEEETGVNIIVCNGADDVNSSSASSFMNGKREYVTPATANSYKTLYKNLGFDIASSTYKVNDSTNAGLSYSVEIGDYRIIVIDASYYEYANGYTKVSGRISDKLMQWIKTECTVARLEGQTVIGMCSWSLASADLAGASDVIINADELANTLADAGMHYIFTSGTHKNDISAIVSDNGNVIYDVQSAGLVSFPNTFRVASFNGVKGFFDVVDADEVKNIVARDGSEFTKPYRENASLKIQYANYDLARYCADIIKNYVGSILIPGIEKNGKLQTFVYAQYGISLTDYINELIGGGINILDLIVVFDASNIMNLLEDIFEQMQSAFLQDDDTLADICYKRLKTVFDTPVSSEKCTAFLETYGIGSSKRDGTLGDFIFSAIIYSKCGNEDASSDKFVSSVVASMQSGELMEELARVLTKTLIRDLVFGDIFSKIEMKPQYLLSFDDSEGSLGSYLQMAFKWFLQMNGGDSSVTGAINYMLKSGIGNLGAYGKSIDEVLDYFIESYYTQEQKDAICSQLSQIIGSYVTDTDPVVKGDYNIEYDGLNDIAYFATKENYRLPSMITITPGNDTSSQAYITWYTKSTVTGSDIEIYSEEDSVFYGKHFIGVDGVSIVTSGENLERTSVVLDLGFIKLGEKVNQFKCHRMKLTGLESGKTYYFRVGDSSKGWWSETLTVSTASDANKVSFIHVSDSMGSSLSDFKVFENILGCADYLYPENDFILHTGNYVDNNNELNQWSALLEGVSKHLVSSYIVPVAGSNDTVATIKNNFAIGNVLSEDQEGVYYSFEYNNIHVTVLDSNYVNEDGTLKEEQLEWLRRDMANAKAKWKFVAVHNPVYTNGDFSQKSTYSAYMNQMSDLMDAYDIDLVFSGSDGVYYRTDGMYDNLVSDLPQVAYPHIINENMHYKTVIKPSGTIYTSLGSSGVRSANADETYDVSKLFAQSGKQINPDLPMFSAVEIHGDILYLTTYMLDGNSAKKVDSFSIRKDLTNMGDVNFDGQITAADARIILRGSSEIELLTKNQHEVADMNGDGHITASDARTVLRISAGLE